MKRYFAKPAPDDPMSSSNVYDRSQPDGTTSTGFRCVEVAVSLEEADWIVRNGGELDVIKHYAVLYDTKHGRAAVVLSATDEQFNKLFDGKRGSRVGYVECSTFAIAVKRASMMENDVAGAWGAEQPIFDALYLESIDAEALLSKDPTR